VFALNFRNMPASAVSIERIDADVTLERSAFDGERDQQVRMVFRQLNLSIAANCRFGLNMSVIEEPSVMLSRQR
jgi:hypothetical protein